MTRVVTPPVVTSTALYLGNSGAVVTVSVPEPSSVTPLRPARLTRRNSSARRGSAANVQPQTENLGSAATWSNDFGAGGSDLIRADTAASVSRSRRPRAAR